MEQDRNYADAFRREFNREPTREDVHAVLARLPMGGDTPSDFDKALKDMVSEGGMTPEAVDDVIAKMASEARSEDEAKADAADRSRRARRRAAWALAASIAMGVAGGVGFAAYRAINDPATIRLRQGYEDKLATMDSEYAARKASLEDQFFGPLVDLTAPAGTIGTSKLERQLSVARWLGIEHFDVETNDSRQVIMDKTSNGIRVLAKQYVVDASYVDSYGKSQQRSESYLMVERRIASDDSIVGVFVYANGDHIGSLTPHSSIVFDGNGARIGDFVTRSIRVVEGIRTVFISSDGFPVYYGLASRVAEQFRELYGRGPNADEPRK